MSTLILRLQGPMQSWGTQSRFSVRDTGLEPSKAGIIGLLCAAEGRPRAKSLADLGALRMGIRVDREGTLQRDYHTAGGGTFRGRPYGVAKANRAKPETVTSTRYYLADAEFVVGLKGDDALLKSLHRSLQAPCWPLYLGRKSFVPCRPVVGPDCLRRGQSLEEALRAEFWLARSERDRKERLSDPRLRAVLDDETGKSPEVRHDVPLSFDPPQFTIRHVRTVCIDLNPELIVEDPLCFSPASS
jgi:CRISPR system Cascade subunit CasD